MGLSSFRLLEFHERLSKGDSLDKAKMSDKLGIDRKTFQRDIDKLRLYYSEKGLGEIIYDRKKNCYRLESRPDQLSKEEIFAICKILIESRAFNKKEFTDIVDKLLKLCQQEESKLVRNAINNEKVNYLELQHGKPLVNEIWEVRQFITKQEVIVLDYERADMTIKQQEVRPVGIVFSEFYFYLLAYQMDEKIKFPTIFRIDRIKKIQSTNKKFFVPYSQRFSEAEFKKRVHFMYAGNLKKIKFEFTGVLEALLDKLPTAQIEKHLDNGVVVAAEVFGDGIDMWLHSQGKNVVMLEDGT